MTSTLPVINAAKQEEKPSTNAQLPARPRSIEDTGLSLSYISDLVVRALYLIGEMTGQELVEDVYKRQAYLCAAHYAP